MSERDASIKKMSDLLRSGATMLSQYCPDCKTPLFRLPSGETICPSCNRRVVFAKGTEVEKTATEAESVSQLEETLLLKVASMKAMMVKAESPEEIEKITKALTALYDLLEKVKKSRP